MSENITLFKKNGEFNGSLSLGGKHSLIAELNRKLRLGYAVKPDNDTQRYLDLRKKWDETLTKKEDTKDLKEASALHKEMMDLFEESASHSPETIKKAWEFYSFEQEQLGIEKEEIPYSLTVKNTLSSIFADKVVNSESVEGFIPTRVREFCLSNGREGFDIAYDDYLEDNKRARSAILIGSHVDFISFLVKSEFRHSYLTFKDGLEASGLMAEKIDGRNEDEEFNYPAKNLEALEEEVASRPIQKIVSLRFVYPVEKALENL